MINDRSVQAVAAARRPDGFVRPLYESFNFAQLPGLIASLFTRGRDEDVAPLLLGPLAGRYRTVIVLFIDAFGWRFYERYHEPYPFLRRFADEGIVTKLTSQFPSTTTAHVTTIHTGLQACESGLYEWYQYEPLLDAVIIPLRYAFAYDSESNTLMPTGIEPSRLYPRTTLYQTLARDGIKPFVFYDQRIASSPFTKVVCDGATIVPFATLRDGLNGLARIASTERQPCYCFLYYGEIDAVGHEHGPDSPPFAAAVESCYGLLESMLHARLRQSRKDVLLLVIADHGQIEFDASRTVFLSETLPDAVEWLRVTRDGRSLGPAGSARDLFLHIRDDHLDEARDRLRERLDGMAEVHRTTDLIEAGLFGSAAPTATFLKRVGNLVVLPHTGASMWWDRHTFKQHFKGHHGGLTPEEAETVLLALRYG